MYQLIKERQSMKPKKCVVGEVYGRLTIIGDAASHTKDRRVNVQCICGNTKVVLLNSLRRGDTTSCGCYLKEVITSHGDSHTRLYKIYKGMLNRCYLPSMSRYESYGGRGIGVCAEWRSSYESFRAWALGKGYDDSLTIERIDVDGDYEPSNCEWIPSTLQARNKQTVKNTSSRYIGVCHCRQTGKWLSYIKIDRVMKNLGRYDTELDAAIARDNYIVSNGYANFHMNNVL